jgi:hypothetical protein
MVEVVIGVLYLVNDQEEPQYIELGWMSMGNGRSMDFHSESRREISSLLGCMVYHLWGIHMVIKMSLSLL